MSILRAMAIAAAAAGLVACSSSPPPPAMTAMGPVVTIPAPVYVAPSGPSLLAQH